MDAPFISVVIPTYNYGHFVAEAIQSVLDQTFRDFEIIVVDDGSTDDTRQVVEAFGPAVRYIYQHNRGPTVTRNVGIRAARGYWIAFLDADDLWLPQKLERQVALIRENDQVGLVYSKVYLFDDKSGAIIGEYPVSQCPQGRVLRDLYLSPFVPSPTYIIRREVFDDVGFFDERIGLSPDDYDMWLRIAGRYEFAFVPEPLAKYRVHTSTGFQKSIEKRERETVALLEKIARQYPDELGSLRRLRLSTFTEQVGWQLIRMGERSSGVQRLKRAIFYAPWRSRPYLLLAFTVLGPHMNPERSRQATLNYFWAKHSLFNHKFGQARREFTRAIMLDPLTYPKAYIGLLLTFTGRTWVDRVRSRIGADRYLITTRPDQEAVFDQW